MPTIELPKGMPPGMTSARRAIHGMPPGMLALSTGPGGPNVGGESDGYRNPSYPDHEDIGEGPWNNHTDMMRFHDHELHPDLAEASIRDVDSHGRWHILVPSALRQQISESGQQDVLTPTHAVHGPAEPDFHDPAHPKVTAWHNDIAYTVPVHPAAVSKEHMQALADYEVHRRQHEKLEQQLRGERDAFGDRRPDLTAEESDRLGRSQRQLNHLHSIMRGAGTAAVGTINPYQKFVRRKFYQAVRQGDLSPREYRGQVLPDREAAIESMYPERRSNRQGQLPSDMKVEEFPGIWSIVNHQGKVTHNGVSSHPYSASFGSPYWREQVLADARNKNLVANRLHHLFGDPPDIDMSKLPISTYGKARKKTAEWFSNQQSGGLRLPPGMIQASNKPIGLAGTEPVEQEPWQVQNVGGVSWKVKDVPMGEGEDNILHYMAAPGYGDQLTPEIVRIRKENNLDVPHDLNVYRGRTFGKDITREGNAPQFMSHGHHAIRELLQAHRPVSLTFTAAEESRQRAYYHVMQHLARDPGVNKEYRFFGKPNDAYFNIVHKSVANQPVYHGMHIREILEQRKRLPPREEALRRKATAIGMSDDEELTDWTQTPNRMKRLQRMQELADAGDTDKDYLYLDPDDYFEPTDEQLQEKREDEENAISGHRPPDYHGLASRLEKEVPFFRGRVRPIGSNGIMVHDPRGSGRLQIGDQPGYSPETRTL
ncbi:MAG: hypothetical protein WCJ35_28265, partial [Planctomycetota bacterium]